MPSPDMRRQPDAREMRHLKLAVGVATIGRPDVLVAMLRRLHEQRRRPDRIVICAPAKEDAGDPDVLAQLGVEALIGARGLTRQRNRILDAVGDCDLVAFFDDDFVPDVGFLDLAETLFSANPDIALATGVVLADGIIGPGLDFSQAEAVLANAPRAPAAGGLRRIYNGYGCNMVVRLAPVVRENLRFDEDLPLYGWLEDVDFSRRLAQFGEIVQVDALRGVHLGVKSGRQSGVRLGYSQIANPVHLMRNRTMSPGRALWLMTRNAGMNISRGLWPEPYIDRRGRLAGNAIAIADLLRRRLHPARAADF